jgi:U3 small nucleolar RNA-associated protein MPP10
LCYSQAERRRLRGAKKAARRKTRKEKLADEKLLSRLQPGLGLNNPYEKRKIREELSMARSKGRVTTGERDGDTDYGASGKKFFKRMQEEVEQSVHPDGDSAKKKRKHSHDGSTKKSSAFKL